MCRLFGLTAGTVRIRATFWLLDAPDSLQVQSHRNADGSGIGFFGPDHQPVLDKQPEPAYADEEFSHEARLAESATFVAHVRLATAGGRTVANTHPFAMRGRIMAHNGGFGEVPRIEAELGPYRELLHGETDSERYFALITRFTDEHGGDVAAGLIAAAGWIGRNLPVISLNTIVISSGELWALRYPATHALHVLQRPAGDGDPEGGMRVRSSIASISVPSLTGAASVVVASERLDGEEGWRMLAPGELLHVGADLRVDSAVVLPDQPARMIELAEKNPNDDS